MDTPTPTVTGRYSLANSNLHIFHSDATVPTWPLVRSTPGCKDHPSPNIMETSTPLVLPLILWTWSTCKSQCKITYQRHNLYFVPVQQTRRTASTALTPPTIASTKTITAKTLSSSLQETADRASLRTEWEVRTLSRMVILDYQPVMAVISTTSSRGIPWAPSRLEETERKCSIPSPHSNFCTTTLALRNKLIWALNRKLSK